MACGDCLLLHPRYQVRRCRRLPNLSPLGESDCAKPRPRWWRARSVGPYLKRLKWNEALLSNVNYQRSHLADFKNSVKGSPLWFDCIERGYPVRNERQPHNSARFVRNSALRFHAAPGTDVANIHKTLCSRRAFPWFHRQITTGTPHDRRVIHTILHSPSPAVAAVFLSAPLTCAAEPLRASIRGQRSCFRPCVAPLEAIKAGALMFK